MIIDNFSTLFPLNFILQARKRKIKKRSRWTMQPPRSSFPTHNQPIFERCINTNSIAFFPSSTVLQKTIQIQIRVHVADSLLIKIASRLATQIEFSIHDQLQDVHRYRMAASNGNTTAPEVSVGFCTVGSRCSSPLTTGSSRYHHCTRMWFNLFSSVSNLYLLLSFPYGCLPTSPTFFPIPPICGVILSRFLVCLQICLCLAV